MRRKKLTMRAGAVDYRVMITPGPLINEGQPYQCVALQELRQILISGEAPMQDRFRLLCHGVVHAWTAEVGTPFGAQNMADFTATVVRSVIRDLNRQGGEKTLLAM